MRLGNRASANKVAGAAELMVGSLGCGVWVSKHVFEVLLMLATLLESGIDCL